MCGKFTAMFSWRTLHGLYAGLGLDDPELAGGPAGEGGGGEDRIETLMPMRPAPILTLDAAGRRAIVPMRWGLTPKWNAGPRGIIHARSETLDDKRHFKDAFASRRGLLVVKTFNEGKEVPSSRPGGRSKTQQFTITPKDGKPIGIAVIWEREAQPDGAEMLTFAMVTTPPNRLIATITDRMPAVLPREHWAKWLGEDPATHDELKAMLTPYDDNGNWDMAPEQPPRPPRPPTPPRAPRVTDKPSQRDLF